MLLGNQDVLNALFFFCGNSMFRTSPMVQELLLHSNKTSLPTANSAVLEFWTQQQKHGIFSVLTPKIQIGALRAQNF